MKKTALFVLLPSFADFEYPLLASPLNDRIQETPSSFQVKTLSLRKEPVPSLGGFTVLPDYGLDDCPEDYAALVLIGGNGWRSEEAQKIAPLARQALASGKVVGAICDATVFLGLHGLLEGKKHTSNTFETLVEGAGAHYTGQKNYQHEQAVRDGNLITANGTGYLEFAKEVLLALEAYPADLIEGYYQFFKQGYIQLQKSMGE